MKSARRDTTEGTLDRIGGRLLEAWGALTGSPSTRAKGRAARLRGAGRRGKGQAKRAMRRR
jgi:uncharacterized protein YjbJ (UPF0337 family)